MFITIARADGKIIGVNLERAESLRFIPAVEATRDAVAAPAKLILGFGGGQTEFFEGEEAVSIFNVIQRDYAA